MEVRVCGCDTYLSGVAVRRGREEGRRGEVGGGGGGGEREARGQAQRQPHEHEEVQEDEPEKRVARHGRQRAEDDEHGHAREKQRPRKLRQEDPRSLWEDVEAAQQQQEHVEGADASEREGRR